MSPAPRHHPEGSVWIHTMMVVGAEKEKRISGNFYVYSVLKSLCQLCIRVKTVGRFNLPSDNNSEFWL